MRWLLIISLLHAANFNGLGDYIAPKHLITLHVKSYYICAAALVKFYLKENEYVCIHDHHHWRT